MDETLISLLNPARPGDVRDAVADSHADQLRAGPAPETRRGGHALIGGFLRNAHVKIPELVSEILTLSMIAT